MTVQQMIESVKQIFPQVLETQIAIEIDSAQKEFCRKSRILRKVASLSSLTSQAQWSVPADFVHLYRVMLYDSNGQVIDKTNAQLDWIVEAGILIIYSTSSSVISSIPTTVSTIYVRYSHLPGAIEDRADSFDVDDADYLEGIYAYVMKSMYSKFPVPIGISRDGTPMYGLHIQMIRYWEREGRSTELLAKKVLNMADSTEREAQYYGYAGRIVLPEEHKISTANTWT